MPPQHEFGPQPLDQILNDLEMKNHDVVAASETQITHKMVSKARKGRRLSKKVQYKILAALNNAQENKQYTLPELFNYEGK